MLILTPKDRKWTSKGKHEWLCLLWFFTEYQDTAGDSFLIFSASDIIRPEIPTVLAAWSRDLPLFCGGNFATTESGLRICLSLACFSNIGLSSTASAAFWLPAFQQVTYNMPLLVWLIVAYEAIPQMKQEMTQDDRERQTEMP